MNVRNMIVAFIEANEGNYVTIGECGGFEIDYNGNNVNLAMDAIEACDDIELRLNNIDDEQRGWALIVNEYGYPPNVADCSGWVSDYLDNNLIEGAY